jgi:hypothetical protein
VAGSWPLLAHGDKLSTRPSISATHFGGRPAFRYQGRVREYPLVVNDVMIFTVPKPFQGLARVHQENAIGSWAHLRPTPDVLVMDGEQGAKEFAVRLGAEHYPDVARNEFGTPLLDSVIATAEASTSTRLLCFINADVILTNDFMRAAKVVAKLERPFLVVGRRRNIRLDERFDFSGDWQRRVIDLADAADDWSGPEWIDYFLFSRGLFGRIPPFAIGRPVYDNWLIWRASKRGAMVIDATDAISAIHQEHDYTYVIRKTREEDAAAQAVKVGHHPLAYTTEGQRNRKLAGGIGTSRHMSILFTRHVLDAHGTISPATDSHHRGAWTRRRRLAVLDITKPIRHKLGLRAANVNRFLSKRARHDSPEEKSKSQSPAGPHTPR